VGIVCGCRRRAGAWTASRPVTAVIPQRDVGRRKEENKVEAICIRKGFRVGRGARNATSEQWKQPWSTRVPEHQRAAVRAAFKVREEHHERHARNCDSGSAEASSIVGASNASTWRCEGEVSGAGRKRERFRRIKKVEVAERRATREEHSEEVGSLARRRE
jgi:hypothetical protein